VQHKSKTEQFSAECVIGIFSSLFRFVYAGIQLSWTHAFMMHLAEMCM